MACNNENNLDMNDELSKVNLSLYEKVIELWRIEEKCRLKLKSIEEINESTTIVNIENDGLEKQLIDVKARMQEVRDNILNIDNITICLYETLAYLEIQYKEKEFSFNKSQSEYELQLFIRMELWQKEEERLNNVPEIKTLKLADLELKNTKLEYENLLKDQDILLENISKAKEENRKKLNDVIVKFATSFIEMLSINKREEQCRVHLRKLDAEFKDKLCMKNSLLESKKHKVNKVSFWYHSPCSLDSNMINMKIDSLNKDSKSSSLYSKNNSQTFSQQHQFDSKHLKLSNEPKPNETFISSSEESSLKINELNSHSEVNLNIAQCSKSLVIDVGEKNIDNNENHGVLDFLTHKRKPIEQQSDFEFKKPYNPFQQEMNRNNNSIMSNVLQSNLTNKNIQMENKLIENQEKDESLNSSVKISQDTLSDNNHTHSSNSVKSAKQSDSMDLTSEEVLKMKLFDDILLQIDESSPYEQNKASSGSYWNNCGVPVSENSRNSSLCGSDLSELFANSYDINQCSDMRLNFMNSLDSDSNTPHESDFQKLKNNVHKQSLEDFMFQPFKNEPFKKTDTKNTKSLNASTSKESNHVTQPTRLNFVSTEPFKFNFN